MIVAECINRLLRSFGLDARWVYLAAVSCRAARGDRSNRAGRLTKNLQRTPDKAVDVYGLAQLDGVRRVPSRANLTKNYPFVRTN
jgi:hypothetical protein